MECPRCHGVMLKEQLYDLLENDGQVYVSGWRRGYRCATCGKISDWVIRQNRKMGRKTVTVDEQTRKAEAGAA